MAIGQLSGLLIQTVVVYRRQQVNGADKTDPFGKPTRDEVEHHRLPCRCTAARGGRVWAERMQDVVQTTHQLFLDAGSDILEDDVVTVLQAPVATADLSSDTHVVTRALVKLVRPVIDGVQEHHVEVDLTTQRPATGTAGGV